MGELLGELVGNKGVYVLNDTDTWTGNANAVVVLEDTVFDTLSDSGGNIKSNYISATGTAVKAGCLITPFKTYNWTTIKLTSGSISIVL